MAFTTNDHKNLIIIDPWRHTETKVQRGHVRVMLGNDNGGDIDAFK